MCGKGTEKNQMAARLMSGCGAPFWRLNKGSSAWKKVKVWTDVAAATFLEDLGRSWLEKGPAHGDNERYVLLLLLLGGGPPK